LDCLSRLVNDPYYENGDGCCGSGTGTGTKCQGLGKVPLKALMSLVQRDRANVMGAIACGARHGDRVGAAL